MLAQTHYAQAEDAPKKTIIHNRIHDRGRSPNTEPCHKPNKDQKNHKNIIRMMLINLELLPIHPNRNFQKYQHKPNKIKNSSYYSSNRAILLRGWIRKIIPDASRSFWYLQILILRKFIFDENFHPNSDFSGA